MAEGGIRIDDDSSSGQPVQGIDERRSPKDGNVDWFDPEVEEGNVEYKLKIKDPNSIRFQQLVLVLCCLTHV